MSAGTNLADLKRSATSARQAVSKREGRVGYLIIRITAPVFLLIGTLLFLYGSQGFNSGTGVSHTEGVIAMVSAGASIVLGFSLFAAPSFIKSRDKVLTRLKNIEAKASNAYLDALTAELVTYGIDIESMSDRSKYLDDEYEFTALRNGEPVDVTLRHYNNEIIFMHDGARMRKSVTA